MMDQVEFAAHYTLQEEPLIGRQAELEQIRHLMDRVRAGQRQILLLSGQPGIGKSRLAAELEREWRLQGGVSFVGRCVSHEQQIPYRGWREVLATALTINLSLAPAQQLQQLTERLAHFDTPSSQSNYWLERLPLIADVLGIESAESDFTRSLSSELRRDNTFTVIEIILRRQTEQGPLLVLLEDIHWADELSLPLTAHLGQKLIDTPLLLILVYRPVLEHDPNELLTIRNLPDVHTLQLEPLSTQESRDLVKVLLKHQPLPKEAEEILLKRSQGNPFFLQEIARTLANNLKHQPHLAALPNTIQEIIGSRVDRLSETEKITLRLAAVIGTNFQPTLLSQAHPVRQARSSLAAHLKKLAGEKLIRSQTIGAASGEYGFRHRITQEVVYEGLLQQERRRLHAIVGLAIEALTPDDVERLAFHFSRSDHRQKALFYLRLAAQKARKEYANYAAIKYYSQILDCLKEEAVEDIDLVVSSEYWDMLLERAKLYHLIGWRDEEVEDLGTLGLMAEALNDNRRRTLVAQQWARFYDTIGDLDSALELIERAATLAQKAGYEQLLGESYNHWGKLLYLRGMFDTAYDYLGKAAVIAQRHKDKAAQADSLRNLGIIVHHQADYEVALYFFQEAIDLWRQSGDQMNLGRSLRHLGEVYYEMGRYAEAQQCFEQALALHRAIGDRTGQALTQYQLGKIQRTLGDYQQAHLLFEEALVFYQSLGDYQREAHTLYHLGFLHNRLEDYETAIALLEKALVIVREAGDPWKLTKALIYYGWTLYNNGQPRKARRYITEALKTARENQLEVAMMEGTALLGQIALTLNDLSLAEACARHILKFIDDHTVQGVEHPALLYLTCYRILKASQKFEQARRILTTGQQYITAQATQIEDSHLRESYLLGVPENREILALTLT